MTTAPAMPSPSPPKAVIHKGVIEHWKILPVASTGVYLVGMLAGRPFQSSRIKEISSLAVKTINDSIYKLGFPDPSPWRETLSYQRPALYAKLIDQRLL